MRPRFDDQGAALVEFGLLAIPLFVILFGIIEFGWAFYQQLDVSHGAREGARIAVVN
ncbi:MAG TPA: TadE/TadG family type IV pilus assembly protein [Acidimicrobiales bacterium]|nr:TadE/TadG family type IV pilus assembly protein [Acidimicrobiales bacterium]